MDEAMLLDHANDRTDVLTAAGRADRNEAPRGVDAQALLVEDGRSEEFPGKGFGGELVGGLATLGVAEDRAMRRDEDGFVIPSDSRGLCAPDVVGFLLALSEAAGGARFVEELLLAVEVELVPVEAVFAGEALGVTYDLAIALAEEIDRFLRDVEGDDRLLVLIVSDPDAQVAEILGEVGLENRAELVDLVGREDARVD